MGFNPIEAEEALEVNEWDVDDSISYIMSGQAGELESRSDARPSRVSHGYYSKQEEIGEEESSLPMSKPSKVRHVYYPKQEYGDEEASLPVTLQNPTKARHVYHHPNEDGAEESSLPLSPPQRPSTQRHGIQRSRWSTPREERLPYYQQDIKSPENSEETKVTGIPKEADDSLLSMTGESTQAPGAEAVPGTGPLPDALRALEEAEEPPMLTAFAVNEDDQGEIVQAVPMHESKETPSTSKRRKYVFIPVCLCLVVLVPVIYTITKYTGLGGAGTASSVASTNCTQIDCEVSSWESWSPCSEKCDGSRTRTRDIVTNPDCNGGSCPNLFEKETCNVGCCVDCEVTKWSDWSTCSATCDGGTRTHNRTVTVPNDDCGKLCPPLQETQACNTQDCCVDCEVSDWSDWGACSADCTSTRTRTVEQAPNSCGTPCPSLEEDQACSDPPCVTEDGPLTTLPPPDDTETCAEIVGDVVERASLYPSGLGSGAQSKALNWLQGAADCDTDTSSQWIQAYAFATIWYSTDGESWASGTDWLGSTNVCDPEWDHITCIGDSATEFLPNSDGLSGTLPQEIGLLTTVGK
jgi:hypothetical protein